MIEFVVLANPVGAEMFFRDLKKIETNGICIRLAESVLPVFEAASSKKSPRSAIEMAKLFAKGKQVQRTIQTGCSCFSTCSKNRETMWD